MKSTGSNSGVKKAFGSIVAETWRFFKTTPYAISVIWRFQPKLLIILCLSTILNGVSPAITVWVMRYFLDAVVNAYQRQGEMEFVTKAIYMLVLQIAVTGGFAGISKSISFFQSVLSSKLSLDMQVDLIGGMSCLEMKDYDNPEIYNMIERARSEAQSNKPLLIVSGVCGIMSNFITWLTFSIILFRFSPIVVAAMFAISIPYLILNIYFGRANFNLQYGRTHDLRAAGYLSSRFSDRRSLPEIITRNLWPFLQNKWSALATMFMRQDISLLKRRNVSELGIIGFTYLIRGGVSLYIVTRCLLHFADYTVGQIMMYIQSFSGGVGALAQVMQQLSGIYEGSCFLQNYQQFLGVQKTSKPAIKSQRKAPNEIVSIECRNVSFSYPGTSTYALRDVNVVFEKGQSTLLVGRNGAGKTTLARLLVGLYSPTEGQILVNGYDMRDYDLILLRKKMSIIFQDFVRYALTAEENIGLGSVEHIKDRQRIVKAAQTAGVHDIIARLPNQYATMLGKEFRDGHDLSLGEWQRVCLARLFMRNASLMVYDEPSASLDIETESELLREISLSAKDRICVLISHRMLRSDIADRIVVIEKGQIVENGSHDALLTLGGRYAHLWNTYHRLNGNGKSIDDDALEHSNYR
jgi:ATP-binding cassette, subfamily B, bacterial